MPACSGSRRTAAAAASLDYEVIGSDNRLHRGIRRLDPYNGGTRGPWHRRAPAYGSRMAAGPSATRGHPGGCRRRALLGGDPRGWDGPQRGEVHRPRVDDRHRPGGVAGCLRRQRPASRRPSRSDGRRHGDRRHPPTATSSAPTGRRAVTSAPEKTLSGNSRKLIACIRAAHGNVTRLRACRRRFPPSYGPRGAAPRTAVSRRGRGLHGFELLRGDLAAIAHRFQRRDLRFRRQRTAGGRSATRSPRTPPSDLGRRRPNEHPARRAVEALVGIESQVRPVIADCDLDAVADIRHEVRLRPP